MDIKSLLTQPMGKAAKKTPGKSVVKAVKYPTKQTMNLFKKEVKPGNEPARLAVVFVLLVVLIGLFTKFLVIDRLTAVSAARQQLEATQAQVNAAAAQLADFDAVSEDYYRYTDNYLTPEELDLMDRLELIALVDGELDESVSVVSTSIVDNSVLITVHADQLSDVARLREGLSQSPCVVGVTVHTADKTPEQEAEATFVEASLLIDVMKTIPEEEAAE